MTEIKRTTSPDADNLVDIASRGIATQSSLSEWSTQQGAQSAVNGDFSKDFTIHTGSTDESPWWMLDLRAWYPVEAIVLKNRRDPSFQERAATVIVEASEDNLAWTVLHSGFVHFGVSDSDDLRIPLSARMPVRFIRVSLASRGYLHLNRVQVLVSRDFDMRRRLLESIGISFANRARYAHGAVRENDYQVLGSGFSERASGLKIRKVSRFANNVYQMVRAIQIAREHNLGFVQMLDSPLFDFSSNNESSSPRLIDASDGAPDDAAVVEGDFFYSERFTGKTGVTSRAGAMTAIAREYLAPHLSIGSPKEPPAPDELVVHIRSGDIFGDDPHPLYGQPPLAFYRWAIERSLTLGFTKIRVVAEDRLSPVIDALEEFLDHRGIPFRMQIGESLENDVATLIAARGVVFGVGTFGHAICMLSSSIEVLFEASRSGVYLSSFAYLDIFRAELGDDYSPFSKWTGSPEQRQMMLTYPLEALTFVEQPSRGALEELRPMTVQPPRPPQHGKEEQAPAATAEVDSHRSIPDSNARGMEAPMPDENRIVRTFPDGSHQSVDAIEGLSVDFKGRGNLVEVADGAVLVNAKLIMGHQGRVVIGKTHPRGLRNVILDLGGKGTGKVLEIGAGTSMESGRFAMVNESDLVVRVGENCLISSNVIFRATDGHAIFDLETRKLINRARPILVGDHVWIGASATIIKGSQVPNGTIIATQAVVTGKFEEENSAIAGNPARVVKKGIGWDRSYITDYREPTD